MPDDRAASTTRSTGTCPDCGARTEVEEERFGPHPAAVSYLIKCFACGYSECGSGHAPAYGTIGTTPAVGGTGAPAHERRFPIQGGWSDAEWRRLPATSVPWAHAEQAYRQYAKLFPDSARHQSLERLAERGGFGRSEFATLYFGGDFTGGADHTFDEYLASLPTEARA